MPQMRHCVPQCRQHLGGGTRSQRQEPLGRHPERSGAVEEWTHGRLPPQPQAIPAIMAYFLRNTLWLISGQNSLNTSVIKSKPTSVTQRCPVFVQVRSALG